MFALKSISAGLVRGLRKSSWALVRPSDTSSSTSSSRELSPPPVVEEPGSGSGWAGRLASTNGLYLGDGLLHEKVLPRDPDCVELLLPEGGAGYGQCPLVLEEADCRLRSPPGGEADELGQDLHGTQLVHQAVPEVQTLTVRDVQSAGRTASTKARSAPFEDWSTWTRSP
jgi:hypothetical protein